MRDQIIEMFPEINDIHDKNLRKQVVDVWEDALTLGGWKPEDMKRIPFTLLADDVRIMFNEHVRTVCRMCIAMYDVLKDAYDDRCKVDHDILIAGAMLADVGKCLEYVEKDGKIVKGRGGEYLRHPFSGVGLCYKHGVSDAVMHVVATHSKEGDHVRRFPESIVFHHADFTDFELVK
ncbi:MAG: hypothetical protein KJ970_04405 [Candidatus Eisenbacteria bacterium]|uniref:HD domain-containing protein n=1 Tax=Eiseniibacteriota bacterium TaxID=2212470 RepID=A0A948RW83_UNCEI|nr:hypothetical protein [Candidatus Eisenbacteria bacterium]MBU1951162.1 hypothetical protein [Candidatus Eisenbacteria bacterium]MBU2690147.1 hypothetical protein [Candidatus Eisenbacteria bacterium]